ncbi:DUF4153 domain-containing protein [Roseovarius pelagicus]|uniref:DUF4153 domain-containing protein n=1 Tax=Roseovarius pelagicus TaxID=2980108 RepID=A0ABY6D9L2_9RHOB|nr:DUF4153 domain-containing protein [Roseovarius pelagicus]UXX82821.1 DUF4153 domain-containing protein [Roseovarius pelagicus]
MAEQTNSAVARGSLALIGAMAGLSLWALYDLVPDMVTNARLVLFLVAGGSAFFGVLLALLGPVRLPRAVLAAGVLSLLAVLLLIWASFRYDLTESFLDTEHHVLAFIYMLVIAVPFVAAGLQEQDGWRDYRLLFDAAWTIVVRYAAALLFVAVVWGVVMLSDSLLGLVGINIIDRLLDIDPVPFLLSGLALGLGLAIVHELSEFVSPFLIIQLLRVLLPVLLVVLSIFILALPMRGLSGLFGGFSAAATLIAVSCAAITLITTAVHRDDDQAVVGHMVTATKLLAILTPVPAMLAVVAVWMRVAQYGLTPDRVAALVAAVVVLVYALAYAVAVFRRAGWAARLRQANRWMALGTILIAALWLSPVLNAERLSVSSQVARAESGVAPDQLALWEMSHEWGRAGSAGLVRILELTQREDHEILVKAVADAQNAKTRWAFERGMNNPQIETLNGIVPLRPEGASLPPGAFDQLSERDRRQLHQACARTLPGGHPACVMVVTEFDPLRAHPQAIALFSASEDRVRMLSLDLRGDILVARGGPVQPGGSGMPLLEPSAIIDVLEGRFEITPVPRNVLDIGGIRLVPQN